MPMSSSLMYLLKGTLQNWTANSRMSLNLSKTWEMLLHRLTSKPAPPPLPGIERKDCLKLLGITFHDTCDWDFHIDSLLSIAASPLYILRICKYYIYTNDQLIALFECLIMSLFLYVLEVWYSASQGKYLHRIDTFIRCAYRSGHTNNNLYTCWRIGTGSIQKNHEWHWSLMVAMVTLGPLEIEAMTSYSPEWELNGLSRSL